MDHLIKIGDKEFTMSPMKGGKVLRILEPVSVLLDECNLASLFSIAGDGKDFIPDLVSMLPMILRKGRPHFFRALALSLIPDKELAELERDETRLEERVRELEGMLAYECDLEQLIDVAKAAASCIGLKNFKKVLAPLVTARR